MRGAAHPAARAFDAAYDALTYKHPDVQKYLDCKWYVDTETGTVVADSAHCVSSDLLTEARGDFLRMVAAGNTLALAAWQAIKTHNFEHYMELCLRRAEMPHGPQ